MTKSTIELAEEILEARQHLDATTKSAGNYLECAPVISRHFVNIKLLEKAEQLAQSVIDNNVKECSPLSELLNQYEEDGNDFADIDWLLNSAIRYSESMSDSQARCILYSLAVVEKARQEQIDNKLSARGEQMPQTPEQFERMADLYEKALLKEKEENSRLRKKLNKKLSQRECYMRGVNAGKEEQREKDAVIAEVMFKETLIDCEYRAGCEIAKTIRETTS